MSAPHTAALRLGELRDVDRAAWEPLARGYKAFYETEVDDEVKNLSTTIEPIMMVFLGVTVGLIVLAVLMPVYNLIGGGLT